MLLVVIPLHSPLHLILLQQLHGSSAAFSQLYRSDIERLYRFEELRYSAVVTIA